MIRQLATISLGVTLLTAGAEAARDGRHLRLERSAPAGDTTITDAPDRIQLWFNQPPQAAVSRVTLTRGDEDVAVGDTRGASENSLVAEISAPLAPARYTVSWRTAGDDGHVLRGTFDFTVGTADTRP